MCARIDDVTCVRWRMAGVPLVPTVTRDAGVDADRGVSS
jgi:hypothetical protein